MGQFWSYASNFEDVLLKRCFPETTDGLYIDIGAHHPVHSSVTKAFYDLGWSGINVEPGEIFDKLEAERPRDLNLHCAVADFEGEAAFFVHHHQTALSSLKFEDADGTASTVPVTTLPAIIDRYAADKHINFLKIDAEGSETAIIRAANWDRHRPEVLVIESTEPFTNVRPEQDWQKVLAANGYLFAYFDGVNDFWVRDESKALVERFKLPVNVLDDFFVHSPQFSRLQRKVSQLEKRLQEERSVIADLTLKHRSPEQLQIVPPRSPSRSKVLYFTAVRLDEGEQSGGMLVCREHVKVLASLKDIDLTVFTTRSEDGHFLASLGVKHVSTRFVNAKGSKIRPLDLRPKKRWPFLWESRAAAQSHIERDLCQLVQELRPEVVIVDYVLSAIWAPSLYRLEVPKITISLNREGDFHRENRLMGRLQEDVSPSPIAEWRLRRFENWIYRKSAAVVTLSENDLPRCELPKAETVVIPPILEEREPRWKYAGNKQLFFVGNVAHYPNYQALEWLATKFAPALARRESDARIIIIGAADGDMPAEWRQPNVEFRGVGTKEDVVECFTTCDLFIVPISNNFGSKTKILECIAHGAPAIATKQSLTGLPFADLFPQFELEQPEEAAALTAELLSDGDKLQELARRLSGDIEPARAAARDAWERLIHKVARRAPRSWFKRPATLARVERKLRYLWKERRRNRNHELEIAVVPSYKVAVSGAHPIEMGSGRRKRWTSGTAEFSVDLSSFKPTRLMVELAPHGPPGGKEVTISANGAPIFADKLSNHQFRREFALPDLQQKTSLQIRIESSVFIPKNGKRTLGVAIESLVLRR